MKKILLITFMALGLNSFSQNTSTRKCLEFNDEKNSNSMVIRSEDGKNYSGTLDTYYNDGEYSASASIEFKAVLDGHKLKAQIKMEFEGEIEEYEEDWEYYLCGDANLLIINGNLYRTIVCP